MPSLAFLKAMLRTEHEKCAVSGFIMPAQRRIIIASAAVHSRELKALLPYVKSGIKVEVYARWHVSDLVDEISDINALFTAEKYGAQFKICDAMKRSIFVADDKALTGGVNSSLASNRKDLSEGAAGGREEREFLEFLGEFSDNARVSPEIFEEAER